MTELHIDQATDGGGVTPPPKVKVWDPVVRVFHWSLVTAFFTAWISAEEWDRVHEWMGYLVLGLITVRILWGIIGARHARFADFVYRPSTILAFLRDSTHLRAKRYLGHNPAGGAMVMALLACLAAVSATGIMLTSDTFWGVEWVEELHEFIVNLTLGLVGLHIAGVVVASLEHRENLVGSMITGWKTNLPKR